MPSPLRDTMYARLGVHAGSTDDELREARMRLVSSLGHGRPGSDDQAIAVANASTAVLRDRTAHAQYRASLKTRSTTECPACTGLGYRSKSAGKGFKAKMLRVACAACLGAGLVTKDSK